jgi:hypothetical protein
MQPKNNLALVRDFRSQEEAFDVIAIGVQKGINPSFVALSSADLIGMHHHRRAVVDPSKEMTTSGLRKFNSPLRTFAT